MQPNYFRKHSVKSDSKISCNLNIYFQIIKMILEGTTTCLFVRHSPETVFEMFFYDDDMSPFFENYPFFLDYEV
jgi:hypothetical protein